MKILVLNGSPKINGNTSFLIKNFKTGAENVGHKVEVIQVSGLNIKPCIGCAYCRNEGNGTCVFKDDMAMVFEKANEADLIVFASPVYYWGFSGQLQSLISRFYSIRRPNAKKYALVLTADSKGAFDSVKTQFNSIVNYFKGDVCGIITSFGEENKSEEKKKEAFSLGARTDIFC